MEQGAADQQVGGRKTQRQSQAEHKGLLEAEAAQRDRQDHGEIEQGQEAGDRDESEWRPGRQAREAGGEGGQEQACSGGAGDEGQGPPSPARHRQAPEAAHEPRRHGGSADHQDAQSHPEAGAPQPGRQAAQNGSRAPRGGQGDSGGQCPGADPEQPREQDREPAGGMAPLVAPEADPDDALGAHRSREQVKERPALQVDPQPPCKPGLPFRQESAGPEDPAGFSRDDTGEDQDHGGQGQRRIRGQEGRAQPFHGDLPQCEPKEQAGEPQFGEPDQVLFKGRGRAGVHVSGGAPWLGQNLGGPEHFHEVLPRLSSFSRSAARPSLGSSARAARAAAPASALRPRSRRICPLRQWAVP